MTETIKILTLVVTDGTDEIPLQFGTPKLFFDGEPVLWATMGDWRVEFGESQIATLHFSVPVRVRVVPPEETP